MNKVALIQHYEDKICKLEILKNCIYMNPKINPEKVYDRYLTIIETVPVIMTDTTDIEAVEEAIADHIKRYKSMKYDLMMKQSQEDIWKGLERIALLSQRIGSFIGM